MLSVSVIIPARNEQDHIAKCLDSVLKQNYDNNLVSVYVCDGLSTDQTQKIVEEYIQSNRNIFLLENEKQTTQHGLNLGLKKAEADVKIILGAHAELASDYIANCVKLLQEKRDVQCVGGVLENVYENQTAAIIGAAMSSKFGVGNAHFRTGANDGYVDTVAFGAYRSEVFDRVGYFDEDLVRNQDDEFNYRIIKNGGKIFLSNSIKAKYYVRSSFSKLWKQYFQYGYWKVYVNQKHKTVTTARQLAPLAFVLFTLSAPVWSLLGLINVYSIIMLTYFLLALLSAALASKRVTHLPSIFMAFLILHLSYGFGYLEGVFKFILLGKTPDRDSLSR